MRTLNRVCKIMVRTHFVKVTECCGDNYTLSYTQLCSALLCSALLCLRVNNVLALLCLALFFCCRPVPP
ncbi:hypothetical protein Pmani_017711 [Petrolisthes manimaculis]|uniref:Uncharacterized protein n=1 Tax=Petrolisthes manimaculis TaxID=1843537 RepID=A0AAE1PLT2_9EUCA|nr:hypothetical protein Pmani_017711 [Petrolisthes manimaculis]